MRELTHKEIAERLREMSVSIAGRDMPMAIEAFAKELDPQPDYPPYGVPVEVQSDNGPWYMGMSVGAGMVRVSTYGGPIREWDEWRIPPVDWERVPEALKSRHIMRSGDVFWYCERTPGGKAAYHIDNRPEASDEV